MLPPFSWSGFYFGVNLGGAFGSQDTSLIDNATGATAASGSVSPNGFIIGDQIGYNWQINQWVLGLEADIQGSTQQEDGTLSGLGSTVDYTSRLRWFGTVRGRVGWAYDRFLPYVTAGWAYGRAQIDGTATTGIVTRNFKNEETLSGWTVGAGVEWVFYGNWSAKIEYLYINLGDGPNNSRRALRSISRAATSSRMLRASG